MVYRCILLLAFCFASSLLRPVTVSAGDFMALCNQLPPIKMVVDGKMQGIAGDVFYTIATNAGLDVARTDVKITSVNDAVESVATSPGTVLLGFVKNSQREPDFKWVGPIYESIIGVIVSTENNLHTTATLDAKYYAVASIKSSAAERLAVLNGFSLDDLHRFDDSSEALDSLTSGAVDMIVMPKLPAFYLLSLKGQPTDDYEVAHELKRVPFYFAFNKQTDDAIIERLQMELDTLKRPGIDGESEYNRIVLKYFRPSL